MSIRPLRCRTAAVVGAVASAVVALAAAWPVHAAATATATTPDAQRAARLIRQTRDAATQIDVRGTADVAWRISSELEHATVDIRDARGAVAIAAGRVEVVHDGQHTFLRDTLGWTSAVVEPPVTSLPSPAARWELATRPGRRIAGRRTIEVVARRPGGKVGERLFVDRTTHLLLGRDVLDPNGRTERAFAYASVDLAAARLHVTAPSGIATPEAESLPRIPHGYDAPKHVGVGFQLVTRSRHANGVWLFYSDGLFSASVFEQRGALDWTQLPSGGTATDMAGHDARRYEVPSGHVVVWEHDGTVYTCVSDAPSDTFALMIAPLGRHDRSTSQRVADFVLGPFSWG